MDSKASDSWQTHKYMYMYRLDYTAYKYSGKVQGDEQKIEIEKEK